MDLVLTPTCDRGTRLRVVQGRDGATSVVEGRNATHYAALICALGTVME